MKKKIVIAGGTGFIGGYLSERFREDGFEVLIIARGREHISWEDKHALSAALESATLLLNLAGKPITSKFTDRNKKALIASRVSTTETLGQAVQRCTQPPSTWINASGAHIYGTGDQRPHTESDIANHSFFLAVMASQWEDAFFKFHLPATKQVAFRTSIVLGKNGGVLQPYIRLARLGLGGRQGNGRQKFSWIHIEDYYQIIGFILNKPEISGPVNICSPDPVNNETLMHTLRKVMHMPVGIPAPEFAIKLGTGIMGIESDLVLKSLWVMPKVLIEAGYTFQYPDLEGALFNIIKD